MQHFRYALLGTNLKHSLSPYVHARFAQTSGIELKYALVAISSWLEDIAYLRSKKFNGFNITAPYKQAAAGAVDLLAPSARESGAVNTIVIKNDTWFGHNTDGIGLIRDLARHQIELRNKKVLILGAGGVVRAILPSLLTQTPQAIFVVNRTPNKAQQIANFFNSPILSTEMPSSAMHVVINATSAIHHGNLLNLPAKALQDAFCYDLNYAKAAQPFLDTALINGAARVTNGLGMLLEQAAEAFYLWHGVRPEVNSLLAQLQQIAGYKSANLVL